MDELLHDPEALAETFAVYRELIGYYVVSNNAHASDVRTHMRRHNHGAFLSSLYQDLCDICSYCGTAEDAKSYDDSAKSDLCGVLLCLSSLVPVSDVSEVSLCALADVWSQCLRHRFRIESFRPSHQRTN